jgi:hypothetical protein
MTRYLVGRYLTDRHAALRERLGKPAIERENR